MESEGLEAGWGCKSRSGREIELQSTGNGVGESWWDWEGSGKKSGGSLGNECQLGGSLG